MSLGERPNDGAGQHYGSERGLIPKERYAQRGAPWIAERAFQMRKLGIGLEILDVDWALLNYGAPSQCRVVGRRSWRFVH